MELSGYPFFITSMDTSGYGSRFQGWGANFVCPICGADSYGPVVVKRPSRRDLYHTEFFECAGCTVMFRDPIRFRKPATVSPIGIKPPAT